MRAANPSGAHYTRYSIETLTQKSENLFLLALGAVWVFGLVTSIAWIFVMQGGKVWQDNWEKHVDVLEPYFSGDLYKLYPNGSDLPNVSVSKINLVVAEAVYLLWLGIGIAAALILERVGVILVTLSIILGALLMIEANKLIFMSMKLYDVGEPEDKLGIKRRKYPDMSERS